MSPPSTADFTRVTETWGLPASLEQLAMAYTRYKIAGDLAEGETVLEIGCGSGMGLNYLAGRARHVTAGDATPELLEEARRHVPTADLVHFGAEDLPFKDASFDVVLMLEMIYYIENLDRALTEARRVLRHGGKLFICEPNRDRPDFNPSPYSVRYPSALELKTMLDRHGFKTRILGGFPVEPASSRDRVLAPIRHLAVRLHLIPKSMRMKATVKRMLYGRLPRLGEVREGMAPFTPPVELDPTGPEVPRYKNLYAIGEAA
jgi:ubiquinone/menaquinone biosynthesis C-methylase UbiE